MMEESNTSANNSPHSKCPGMWLTSFSSNHFVSFITPWMWAFSSWKKILPSQKCFIARWTWSLRTKWLFWALSIKGLNEQSDCSERSVIFCDPVNGPVKYPQLSTRITGSPHCEGQAFRFSINLFLFCIHGLLDSWVNNWQSLKMKSLFNILADTFIPYNSSCCDTRIYFSHVTWKTKEKRKTG